MVTHLPATATAHPFALAAPMAGDGLQANITMDGAVLPVGVWDGQAPDVQGEGVALVSESATGTRVTHPLGKVPAILL